MSGWLRRFKARLDEQNERALQEMPLHERDQLEAAASSWKGTLRQLWTQFKEGLQ